MKHLTQDTMRVSPPDLDLKFTRKVAYGRERFYPANEKARAILEVAGKKCLEADGMMRLNRDFVVTLLQD